LDATLNWIGKLTKFEIIYNMGGDGGSIPKRDDLVKTRTKPEQVVSWNITSLFVRYAAWNYTHRWYKNKLQKLILKFI